MSRTFFIPGMQPSTGGTAARPAWPTQEQLSSRHPDYYANRGEYSTASFLDPGDRIKLHGDEAEVKHVERNSDGTQELTVQRSALGNSGTYKVRVEPDNGRKQQIGAIRRSFD